MSIKENNIFFMDIFNKILKINKREIVIIYDINNNIWFGLRDIIKALDYKNYKKSNNQLKINKINIKIYSKLKGTPSGVPFKSNQPHKKFINESGLYELLSLSRKPLAKIFMDKYFKEIMPKIRETGSFILNKANQQQLININEKLIETKNMNKQLLNNQRNIVYPIQKALYIIIKYINMKKYYKIGYTKNLNKRLNVYNTSFPNKILFNYYLLIDNKKIDKCIKQIMKNEEFIKNKEYYMTTFNKILIFINKCNIKLNKIYCGYCLKSFNFDKIKLHKCKYI